MKIVNGPKAFSVLEGDLYVNYQRGKDLPNSLSDEWTSEDITVQDLETLCGLWAKGDDTIKMRFIGESAGFYSFAWNENKRAWQSMFSQSMRVVRRVLKGYTRIESIPEQCLPKPAKPKEYYHVPFPMLAESEPPTENTVRGTDTFEGVCDLQREYLFGRLGVNFKEKEEIGDE